MIYGCGLAIADDHYCATTVSFFQGSTKTVSNGLRLVDWCVGQAHFINHLLDYPRRLRGRLWDGQELGREEKLPLCPSISPWGLRGWYCTWWASVVRNFHSSFDCWLNFRLVESSFRSIDLKCRLPKGQAKILIFVKPCFWYWSTH